MEKIDYSSEAITRRLKRTDQLRVLSISLIEAKREHDEKKLALAKENEAESKKAKEPKP